MTYDDALANFFDIPELSVIAAIDALTANGYTRDAAYRGVIDLSLKGLLGHKAQRDFSLDISAYGLSAAAMIRDILPSLPTLAP